MTAESATSVVKAALWQVYEALTSDVLLRGKQSDLLDAETAKA